MQSFVGVAAPPSLRAATVRATSLPHLGASPRFPQHVEPHAMAAVQVVAVVGQSRRSRLASGVAGSPWSTGSMLSKCMASVLRAEHLHGVVLRAINVHVRAVDLV